MSNFLEDFMGSIGPEVATKLGSSLNVDQSTMQKIIPLVAPMILGGLKKQSESFGG